MLPSITKIKVLSTASGTKSQPNSKESVAPADEIAKAIRVMIRFLNRPERLLSKSTKPPAIMPKINGILCSEILSNQIPMAARLVVIKIGKVLNT